MTFTTRPEISGTFGMVTSTHWLATAAGMKMLEAGGSAADAAVATGFVLNVVEPHLNGPLGDMPLLYRAAGAEEPVVICGQGTAPAGATIDHYRAEGLTRIPGSGLLATVVPGAFDAWMLLLRDHGRLPLAEVLAPAIHYARHGHPILPRVANEIAGMADVFRKEWPTSAPVWLPGGSAPQAGALFANPALAEFWERLVDEAKGAGVDRVAQIEAARRAFYEGFVAEAIDDFLREAEVLDASGQRHKGVLTGQDMANWRASFEAPISVDHAGWTAWKCGGWTQGPVLLQALQMLRGDDLAGMDQMGPDFVHLVSEALKLAFADRDAYLGEPNGKALPLETLLSAGYGAARRAEIGDSASLDFRPGSIAGYEDWADAFRARVAEPVPDDTGIGIGEPTMAHLTAKRGDTCHVDVVDRWGNMVSATPSGGWLKSSPVVPGLGVPLNTRAQMFWLEDGLPTSLAPGRRPRTTLSPSMAQAPDGTKLAFGTPGGDQQDQWQLTFLLRLIHHGMNLQEAIDGPLFHTGHLLESFYPRGTRSGYLMIEPNFPQATLAELDRRGHRLEVSDPWAIGRLTAARIRPDGIMSAAATPRLMQAYAAGR
ncbi:gamma-glutamyltransferase family protein [Nioella sp.]|uniref:gamma-glutamyltransferase family protein n=1 Tax=Nioella sp. TaxID=1912091 RepID=UPI003B51B752